LQISVPGTPGHQIEEDEVRHLVLDPRARLLAVVCNDGFEASLLQAEFEHLHDVGLVLDDQDPLSRHRDRS